MSAGFWMLLYRLLAGAATIAAVWWAYRRSRLTSVLIYLVWTVIARFGVPFGLDHLRSLATWQVTVSYASNLASTLLFVWMMVSLANWGVVASAGEPGYRRSPAEPSPPR